MNDCGHYITLHYIYQYLLLYPRYTHQDHSGMVTQILKIGYVKQPEKRPN